MNRFTNIFLFLILTLCVGVVKAQSDELVNVCALGIGNATYLKDYKVKLSASSVTPPVAKFNVIMNKGTMYKITACNAEGYEGQAVVTLMENAASLGTNIKADGTFVTAIGFTCNKTGMYNINVSFKDGKEGAAVVILSYINAK